LIDGRLRRSVRDPAVVADVSDEVSTDLPEANRHVIAVQLEAVSVAATRDGLKRESIGLVERR